MKIRITEIVKTTNLSDGSSKEETSTANGTVTAHCQSQLKVICNPRQPIGDSRATLEAKNVRVEARHHATCQELGLNEREVLVEHQETTDKGSVYLLRIP